MVKYKSVLFQGNFVELNSFTLVNRRLVSGLRERGYDVTVFPLENCRGVELARVNYFLTKPTLQ